MTNTVERPAATRSRGRWPAVALFLLSPLFGEYLLGNMAFSALPLLPLLALLYGAGSLLIRETARRFGRGSATMLLLGVAYALIEEGLVDQMLFNHDYFAGQAQESDTILTALGIDAWLTLVVVAMHTIWSTYIPITLMEALVPGKATRPWLGPVGTAVTVVIFVAGSVYLGWAVYDETGFVASAGQLIGTSVVVIVLVAAAFLIPRQRVRSDRAAPRLWFAGLVAFAASSLFMLTEALPGWTEVAAAGALVVAFVVVVTRWSRSRDFGFRHRLALVAGGVFTYAWLGLTMEPETGPRSTLDQVGAVLIAGFAIVLVVLAFRATRGDQTRQPDPDRPSSIR
ncbi:hypothetical protein [Cryptosporangium aurantiacum]|uniref:DUF998 domain-containing protein n=1 Tax=Cryptosporangium aurantiacum TaxID=134849 RepID=A0A1M7RJH1_9ACTN|nr:hypothetical protein [Cryptosporangium aurantiacum]SHN46312.1 hypothetical protein SAMN05443668_114146 [Cryptosporangium aurantiacum]